MRILSLLFRAIIFLVLTGAVLVVVFVRVPDRVGGPSESGAPERLEIREDGVGEPQIPEAPENGEGIPDGKVGAGSSGEPPEVSQTHEEGDIYLTAEEISSMEEMSLGEKLTGLAILSKLKKEVLNQIYVMARDGITTNEAEDIECLLQDNLGKEDINAIKTMLHK